MDYMKYFKRTDIVKIFEEVCKTECIHPEKLFCNGCIVREIFDNIDELPAADVEEVIRCKECKYGVRPVLAGQMKCNKDGERWVFFDGYCDLAERRG